MDEVLLLNIWAPNNSLDYEGGSAGQLEKRTWWIMSLKSLKRRKRNVLIRL